VFVQLQPDGAGGDLLHQRLGAAGVALAEQADVDRPSLHGGQHLFDVPRAGRAGGGIGAGGRARAPADQGGDAAGQRLVHQLRADEVHVRVDAASRDDLAFAGDDLGARADGDVHAGLDVRIAGLADALDAAVLDADVGLDHAPVIEDDGVGDDGIGHLRGWPLRLAHAIAYHLAAAELDLFAVNGVVALDGDEELGVGQPHADATVRAVHLRVGAALYLRATSFLMSLPAKP